MKKTIKFAISAAVGSVMLAGSAHAAGIDGVWTTPAGWKVKVYKCGASRCGRVIGGTTKRDEHNPNKALRSRKMVGVRMIWGMKKSGSGFKGKLYNPNDGKTYTGKMSLNNARSLKLSGCALAGLICKSQTWRK
jgi:uncharacterized protein (DUF2147 family)